MATIVKTRNNTYSIFNKFYTLRYKFKDGILIGVILSEDHSDKSILTRYHYEILNAMDINNIYIHGMHSVNLYVDGIYNFITVTFKIDDEDKWDDFKSISVNSVIKSAKELLDSIITADKSYEKYGRAYFTSEVEEKNFLQKLFSIMGWEMFDILSAEKFIDDVFYQSFERACLDYNKGREYTQIPDAKTVFKAYHKCLKRWNVVEEEA